ncbi:phosphotransferase [Solibacillus sp. FSL R7-0682]|uniref:phosphotransferase n=1 Tax=Solibacillus sp. FSL R7-0682 TaxID=2921690 RepID=UPI0030FBDEF5
MAFTIPINQILDHWNIDIQQFRVIRDSDKKLIEIESINGEQFILKAEKYTNYRINDVCIFANQLANILPCTSFLKTTANSFVVQFGTFIYTLERRVYGAELQYVNDRVLTNIATALGKMHQLSLQQNIRLFQSTSWAMFGGNQTEKLGDYDENELSFLKLQESYPKEEITALISTYYNAHREKLRLMWPSLPKAATQGDFCYYNMLFNEKYEISGLFDFNIAGDEVLVNECIAVGIYLCWHVEYKGHKTPEERFISFINQYCTQREFNAIEKEAVLHLFAIIRAFRFDRIEEGIANASTITNFLEETLNLLMKPFALFSD